MTLMTLTREDLYSRVWKEPMAKVAARLGLSTVQLERVCETLDVPYPFSGYWTSSATSQRKNRPLRDAKAGTPMSLEMERPTPRRKSTRKAAPGPAAPAVENKGKVVQPSEPSALAVRPLGKLHPFIEARNADERRSNELWGGAYKLPTRRVTTVEKRRRVIENLLLKSAEKAGHKAELVNRSFHQIRIVVAGQPISYMLRERYTQKRRLLTPEELKDPENIRSGRKWVQPQIMTGELRLIAEASSAWAKAEWQDKPSLPLEDQMGEIIKGLESLSVKASEALARRREEERKQWEEQALRREAEQETRRDSEQWARLRDLAVRSEEAQRMTSFLADLRGQLSPSDLTPEVEDWFNWAGRWAQDWDPRSAGTLAILADVRAWNGG